MGWSHARVVEHDVDVAHGLLGANENLEIAFQGIGGHTHDIVLAGADEFFVGRERLGHGPVDLLLGLVGDGIRIQGDALQGGHLFLGDAGGGVAALHPGARDLLPDAVTRQSDHDLQNLDVKFVFRFLDGGLQGDGGPFGVEDATVADPVGRGLLVVDDLNVISFDLGHAQGNLGGAEVGGCYVSFCLHIICCLYFTLTVL